MIGKNDILKFVRHVHKRGRGIPDRRLIHPRREWLVGVAVFLLSIAAGGVWSLYSFSIYSSLDEQSYKLPKTIPNYNQRLVTTVLEEYSDRRSDYDLFTEVASLNQVKEPTITASTSPLTTTEEIASSSPTTSTTTSETELLTE